MSVATSTAIALGVTAATGAVGAGLSYAGQKGIAKSADKAANLQQSEADKSLAFQKQEYADQQKNQAPFLKAGQDAIGNLTSLMAPGGDLSKSWTGEFNAPTEEEAQATPGYKFTLQQGRDAITNSSAAQGNLISGGSLTALDKYSQGLASGTYQQSFNNALTQYDQKYNEFQQKQANTYNRLAGIAGLGQTTAGQLGQEGQTAATNITNTNLGTGAQIGQDYMNAASSRASGYNAVGNTIGGLGNNIVGGLTLQQILNSQQPPDYSNINAGG